MSRRDEQEQEMAKRGWITIAAATNILRVDQATVYRRIGLGEIKTQKVLSRTYVSEQDIKRLAGPLGESEAT